MECEVESVECGVWSVKCGEWSGKCRVWSVECTVSVKCEVRSVERVKCRACWSVECGV